MVVKSSESFEPRVFGVSVDRVPSAVVVTPVLHQEPIGHHGTINARLDSEAGHRNVSRILRQSLVMRFG